MENEILLATSDGFYYKGTPSIGTYPVSKGNEAYTSYAKTDESDEEALNKIAETLVISQLVIIVLILVCVIKGLIEQQKNKKNEASEGQIEEENKSSKKYLLYYIFATVLTVGFGCIEIIKGFLENL